jgi:hypothetical protein
MTRRTISKILIGTFAVILAAAAGFLIYLAVAKSNSPGKIDAETKYYLSYIRPKTFYSVGGTAIRYSADSYFQFNDDKKTGAFYFGDTDTTVVFIITKYSQGSKDASFNIEYIHNGEVILLRATGSGDNITFKRIRDYSVGITQEHPDNTTSISYDTEVLEFTRGQE